MRIAIVYGKDQVAAQKWRDAIAALLREAQVDIWQVGSNTQFDYAVGWAPPAEFFATQPQLRAFFSTGAGIEHVVHNPRLPPELPVIRVEDAGMGPQMIDYCRYEVLRWMQRRDEYAAQQTNGVWNQHSASFRAQWPIGVFGFGVLGRQVASAFAADGFPVTAYSRSAGSGEPNVRLFSEAHGPGEFAAFMRATRVLAILAPLTAATQDKFDRPALQLLPPSSYVINIARGGLIVDSALLELLDSGHLAGAALDVFREEPLPPEHRFWSHPKVRITPHVAAITPIGPASIQIAQKIQRLARDESVTGVVERQRGY
jgi:glyoxylate/hydroxypyruvate reductase